MDKLFLYTINLNRVKTQPWCSTEVDENGVHVEEQGNWGDCGPDCPMHPNAWTTDDTLKVTHHYSDQKETMIAVKLFGILASSLLLTALIFTRLGIFGSQI